MQHSINNWLSAAAEKRVAIIIVNWNGWEDTVDCLDTVFSQDYLNYTVVVVDNDSQDGSVERIAAWCERPYRVGELARFDDVRRLSDVSHPGRISYRTCNPGLCLEAFDDYRLSIVRSGANLGFAGGCNVGAEFVGYDEFHYLWFLNSDTIVRKSTLAELVNHALSVSFAGMIGSTLLYYWRPTVIQAMGGADLHLPSCVIRHRGEGAERAVLQKKIQDLEYFSGPTYIVGASMLVPVSVAGTIGLMQTDYFLYYEEIDWAFRARGRYRQMHAPLSILFHKSGASSKDKVSEFAKQLLFRNKLVFFARYIPHYALRLRYEMAKELLRDALKGRWQISRILVLVLIRTGASARTASLLGGPHGTEMDS